MHTIAFLILLFFICICIHVLKGHQWKARRLPPRLTLYTIIQNMGAIFRSPHQAFAKLSKTHGPIFCLKILNMTIVFMCSSLLAKEVLQKQDKVLSDRPVPDAARALNHHEQSIVWLPSSTKWRELRKICVTHIFSSQKILAKIGLRQEKLQQLLNHVHDCCNKSQTIDIGQVVFITSLNVLSNTLFSIDLASYDSNWAYEFKQSVLGISKQIGSPNTADYFSGLSLIDPQGIRQAAKIYMKNIIAIFEGIVNQRLEAREISADNDALDILLKLHKENNSEFSLDDIKHLLLDLFIAGAETTSSTLQWAMAEVFRNSKVLSKIKLELQHAIPKDTKIQESDIQNLPYLQAIIKETYRLHPPIPLAVHEARCDVEISGFTVPKNAQVVVNLWAVGRDSNVWSNPDLFMPERFLGLQISANGQDFGLLPYGAGRRMCVAVPLADRMLHLVLGSLLHMFDWKLEGGIGPDDLNMEEKYRFTVQKAIPLKAIPVRA